jgi:hypothetical protein
MKEYQFKSAFKELDSKKATSSCSQTGKAVRYVSLLNVDAYGN